jgi:signal transduction histidine kinase
VLITSQVDLMNVPFDQFFNPFTPDAWRELPPEQFMRHTSHELLNELMAIRIYLEVLQTKIENDPQADAPLFGKMTTREMLAAANVNCEHLKLGLQTLYAYARASDQPQPEPSRL